MDYTQLTFQIVIGIILGWLVIRNSILWVSVIKWKDIVKRQLANRQSGKRV